MKKLITKVSLTGKSKKQIVIIITILLSVLSILLFVAFLLLKDDQNKPSPSSSEPTITFSTENPDESKENAQNYKWGGASDEPRKIRISKINVDAFVQKSGVDQNKKVAVPNNVHLGGWFAEGQKPGQNGLSIIAGHVSGRKSDGVFKLLGNLAPGDTFEVELGSGQVVKYKVLETKQFKEADSADYLFSQNPKVKSQLNLITCGGSFDEKARSYEDRVIVSAELIS